MFAETASEFRIQSGAPPDQHRRKSTTQVVLPFTGLEGPFGVAVDTAGTVYVTDFDNNRVVMLAAGARVYGPWPNL